MRCPCGAHAAKAVIVLLARWWCLPAEHVPGVEPAWLMSAPCRIHRDRTPRASSGALLPMTSRPPWADGTLPLAAVEASSSGRAHAPSG
jgi:hypothetical protein